MSDADAHDVPLEVSDLTPEWLESVLRPHSPSVKVAAVTLLDQHSGTTGRARIGVEYEQAHPTLPSSFFVKLSPFDEGQRAFVNNVGMGVAEARFYQDLATDVPVRTARPWHASYSGPKGEERYVMLLEDLAPEGCAFPSPADENAADRCEAVIMAMADYHGAFWESSRSATDLSWVAPRGAGTGDGGRSLIELALTNIAERLPEEWNAMAQWYVANNTVAMHAWTDGAKTLAHGDAHMGNMFFDGATPGFLDWAMVGCSPSLRDVAYFMSSSVPGDVRRAHEREWIDAYRAKLAADHGVALDGDTAWRQYRLFAVNGWLAASVTAAMGSFWQPEHVGLGGTLRATATITDLDSLALFREIAAS